MKSRLLNEKHLVLKEEDLFHPMANGSPMFRIIQGDRRYILKHFRNPGHLNKYLQMEEMNQSGLVMAANYSIGKTTK